MLPLWPDEDKQADSPAERACQRCGKMFPIPHKNRSKHYCSPACYWTALKTPDEEAEHVCEYCGKMFVPPHHRTRRQRFCSNVCSQRSKTGRDYSLRTCMSCGQLFEWQQNSQVYCSKPCKIAHMRQKRDERIANLPVATCLCCGKSFQVGLRDKRVSGLYCSRQCVMRSEQVRTSVILALKDKPGHKLSAATRQKLSAISKARWAALSHDKREAHSVAMAAKWPKRLTEKQRASFIANQQFKPIDRFGIATCPVCDVTFARKRRHQDHCSKECAHRFIRKPEWYANMEAYHLLHRASTEQERRRICRGCGIEFIMMRLSEQRQFCSKRCYLRNAGGHLAQWQASNTELKVHAVLDEWGVDYQTQIKVGRYWADIYVPLFHLILEVNGCYWHGCAECGFFSATKYQQDTLRADYMRGLGYRFAAVWEHDIKADIYAALTSTFQDALRDR